MKIKLFLVRCISVQDLKWWGYVGTFYNCIFVQCFKFSYHNPEFSITGILTSINVQRKDTLRFFLLLNNCTKYFVWLWVYTGCSIWEKTERNSFSTETVHIWPHMLVMPKCVWEAVVLWKNVNKQLKNLNKFLKIEKELPLLKPTLALPTQGQICTVSVLQPFFSDFFQIECLVCLCCVQKCVAAGLENNFLGPKTDASNELAFISRSNRYRNKTAKSNFFVFFFY